jgi:hypothetical protein
VYFDSLWWWRAEFGGLSNPYDKTGNDQETGTTTAGTAASSILLTGTPNMDMLADLSSVDLSAFPDLLFDPSQVSTWPWEGGLDWNYF